jgi:hypothetical protein
MPWTAADAEKHHEGLSDHQKEVWARVANDILERTGDEGRAIRGANAAVNRMREGASWETAYAEAMTEVKLEESTWHG